ncbi:MAG TPA: MerR family transcriptional regulator [Candidatus Limnocylindria bacterium]|nr:MerR family transcriptional regulator [Candidatus Limnocylindria bacterium]
MPPDTAFTLQELADLADVTPRTVRYYIAQGLLPAPTGSGPGAHYEDAHLDRLRLIKRLQRAHQPLAAIRAQVGGLNDGQVARLADSDHQPPTDSAVDYIRAVMRDEPPVAAPPPPPVPAMATPLPPALPDRSQWERVALTPDIELHIRRPLMRHQNKRVDRLIAIARELLEEETP